MMRRYAVVIISITLLSIIFCFFPSNINGSSIYSSSFSSLKNANEFDFNPSKKNNLINKHNIKPHTPKTFYANTPVFKEFKSRFLTTPHHRHRKNKVSPFLSSHSRYDPMIHGIAFRKIKPKRGNKKVQKSSNKPSSKVKSTLKSHSTHLHSHRLTEIESYTTTVTDSIVSTDSIRPGSGSGGTVGLVDPASVTRSGQAGKHFFFKNQSS
jgi:hypothetical protein